MPELTASKLISTPCTGVCRIEAPQNICAGCGRTLAEIAGWGRMSETQRLKIMAGLEQRKASMGETG
ncbi:DUF1289 domain-containing protein [Rhizobium paknamense]|uniref:Fe-S protein YdhL (DUF1289 family) n=1 Tax=Rhizobium paknamense TaxID=1206817 RepID=A0ABU0IFZ2_9HYPH|nr:DUF1289 domain-containing protein [Rhizobium paknamense]MDQ0457180.1 putative Fe-S protein YdhL (DUF1289 family) [Rhizobium paknamense]